MSTPATGTSIIYCVVDDIIAVYALLTQRGVAFEEPPHVIARMPDHDLWMALCKDSEGNYVGVMSEVRGLTRLREWLLRAFSCNPCGGTPDADAKDSARLVAGPGDRRVR